ncbi:Fic family protein [Lishizhenia tianjinensis]|uniref:Fic family protein n=1 Tax=Lishizhenia tianjinensis TaxID=477690 RepID=A0A1I7BWD4_9FLAO|nr:Fic family protein [Lishizhenia tianjinensis]SFT91512.1 Fic family protein [Lishizhenia tianjinensis]
MNILKTQRTNLQLKVKDLAQISGIDQALISKFENGKRLPTKQQIILLAKHLQLPLDDALAWWMKEKIISQIDDYQIAERALQMVMEDVVEYNSRQPRPYEHFEDKLKYLDELLSELQQLRSFDSYRVAQALELEYTFNSNKIEGNTLTLRETDLVVNQGLTISGKSMNEHLEAINHQEALEYLKEIIHKKIAFSEREVLQLHNLILRGINQKEAGKYRNVQVMIQGSQHMPPAPYLVNKQMEDYFFWYEANKYKYHPVILAAEMHERLVTIHPFIDGNGRTARLVMNLVLLSHGFVIADIKGDLSNRMNYYESLEKAQVEGDKDDFYNFIIDTEIKSLQRYISILRS